MAGLVLDPRDQGGADLSRKGGGVLANLEALRHRHGWLSELAGKEVSLETASSLMIHRGSARDLREILPLAAVDFPPEELLPPGTCEGLMSRGRYHLLVAHPASEMRLAGYAFVFTPKSEKTAWLDLMAVPSSLRCSGYGGELFEALFRRFLKRGHLGMFIEVEIPNSKDSEERRNQERRLAFYRRHGAQVLDVPYQLPTLAGSLPMLLMFRPAPGLGVLPGMVIQRTICEAFDYIHSDVPHRGAVWAS